MSGHYQCEVSYLISEKDGLEEVFSELKRACEEAIINHKEVKIDVWTPNGFHPLRAAHAACDFPLFPEHGETD